MTLLHGLLLPALDQPISPILPHRFQQSVAGVTVLLLCYHQTLIHQTHQKVKHFPVFDTGANADGLRCLRCPPACQDRNTTKQGFLRKREQIIRPVDQCPQGLLPGQSSSAASREQAEAVVEFAVDLLHRQRAHSGGSEFYGKGNTIELSA